MNQLEELRQAHSVLTNALRNLRADLTANRLLNDAMLIAMTANARAALEANFQTLSERWLAGALAHSKDPTDQTVHATQRAIDQIRERLQKLPMS